MSERVLTTFTLIAALSSGAALIIDPLVGVVLIGATAVLAIFIRKRRARQA